MALNGVLHRFRIFRSSEIRDLSNRTCPDVELGEKCEDQCYLVFLECVENCETNECISECNRSVTECEADCPCQTNCPDGCTGCSHPICGTQTTTSTTTTTTTLSEFAILVLNTYKSANKPILLNSNGQVTIETTFEFGENTEVYGSCSATFQNEFYVFGGYREEYQISKIQDCQLNRIGDLEFPLWSGTVLNVYENESEKLYFCFDRYDIKRCRMWDGLSFSNIDDSKYDHQNTRLGAYNGRPFIVGSSKGTFKNKVEIYEESRQWVELDNYPFSPWISDYGIISTISSVFIFGGYTGSTEESHIVEYNENGWSEVSQMKDSRRGHSVFQMSDRVIIVGGKNEK